MDSMLRQIQDLDPPMYAPATQEYHALRQKVDTYYAEIEKALTGAFFQDFYAAESALLSLEVDESFARGFRRGARLMMEVLV